VVTLFKRKQRPAGLPGLRGAPAASGPTYRVGSYSTTAVDAPPAPGRKAARAGKAAQDGPRFGYPLTLRLLPWAVALLIVLCGALRALHLLGAFVGLFGNFTMYSVLLVVTALLGLAASLAVAALVVDALPALQMQAQGLSVPTFPRTTVIPWQRIAKVHSLTLPGDRYLVFVEYAGRPLWPTHVVYALLAGLGPRAGIFFTSQIEEFEDLTRAILDMRMRFTPGLRAEDLLVEDGSLPVIQMAVNPLGTMDAARGPAPDPEARATPVRLTRTERLALTRTQLAIAAVPVLLFWVDNLVNGGAPLLSDTAWSLAAGSVGLLLLGALELPFVALAIQAVGESAHGEGEFSRPLRAYPYLELPRLLVFAVLIALAAINAPFFLLFLLWLGAAAYTAYLTLLFTQSLYNVSQNQAMMAAGAAGLVQFFVLLAFSLLRFGGLAV
jgi:hypothetical protein